jgi:hypothetical protein
MTLKTAVRLLAVLAISAVSTMAQDPAPNLARRTVAPVSQLMQEVRAYRMDNEKRIVRELREFLAIPNVASDTENIQKNAAHLVEMLEARGIETHLLPPQAAGRWSSAS